jgi:CubicO group peptidase (beta-lactamase class C family)
MKPTKICLAILGSMLFLIACQSHQKPIESINTSTPEMRSFADSFFPGKMDEYHIPGLAFIFVQEGEVIYSHAYGFANLEESIPLNNQSSIMRIASVSKSFVATAVMQLVERGELDLQEDINQYLRSFEIRSSYSRPVTLAHLLTHTAGFEDPPYIFNTDPNLVQPLEVFLAKSLPSPTHSPGKTFIYSNYGYALAALIVEEVSSIPFYQYVEQNIFQPLKMDQSQYLLSPPLPENMATGYAYQDGKQIPQPIDYDSEYPAGSIISTAEEMSHFILAHLQDGCYQDSCILLPKTISTMHAHQATTPYEDQNVTYGFVEGIENGIRMIGHSGSTLGFGNSLNMLPGYSMGYFISFNAECYQTNACQIISDFRREFINFFFLEK